jgi:hypothetical protein
MAVVLQHLGGILLVDYMPHKTRITGDASAAVIQKLKEVIKENH